MNMTSNVNMAETILMWPEKDWIIEINQLKYACSVGIFVRSYTRWPGLTNDQ